MPCLVCHRSTDGVWCRWCRTRCEPGGIRLVGGLVVLSAFAHRGPARVLVHRLKYEAMPAAAWPLAERMARSIPDDATGLVPIPRSLGRRVRYGIDPAVELADRIAGITGLPVLHRLRAPVLSRRHAGKPRSRRIPTSFRVAGPVGGRAVLVDDVLTTGGTLAAAAAAFRDAGCTPPTDAATGTLSRPLN